ncbi:MAG TPA: DUF6544 family protein [Methanoregula sp.]|nr:DUF6544 family protein [Methanoregula sp.]
MLVEVLAGILIFIAVFLLIVIIGSNLFAIMIEEKARYLLLTIFNASLPATKSIPSNPKPVSRYLSWALGKNTDPVGSVHIRHTGRFRYGNSERWLNLKGEAFFSLATPGFVWHAKIAYTPGIWIEAFDYYVHREAGMNLNLLSVFPLDNSHGDKIKLPSLFRYLASAPLFPTALLPGVSLEWKTVNDSTARAFIKDNNLCAEALVHFDGTGQIQSIEACHRNHPETGRPVPGHFIKKFFDYTDVQGYKIPLQISSELILRDGEYACTDFTITSIEFEIPGKISRSES